MTSKKTIKLLKKATVVKEEVSKFAEVRRTSTENNLLLNKNHQVIFDRSFSSEKPNFGKYDDVQVCDIITFLDEEIAFFTREVADVKGLLVITKPFPNERSFMIKKETITQILRPIAQE